MVRLSRKRYPRHRQPGRGGGGGGGWAPDDLFSSGENTISTTHRVHQTVLRLRVAQNRYHPSGMHVHKTKRRMKNR